MVDLALETGMATTSLHVELDAQLHDEFVKAAQAGDRTAEQLVLEFMRDYVARLGEEDGYETFLRLKINKARASAKAGRLFSNDDVDREFAAKRART